MAMFENNIAPSFIKSLEDMLNVNLYMEGLTNIFSLPEYNDIEKKSKDSASVNYCFNSNIIKNGGKQRCYENPY